MFKLPEEQCSVPVRRQTTLPAHLKDYDLSGLHKTSRLQLPPSKPVQQNEEEGEE